jgi:hypothetical protein
MPNKFGGFPIPLSGLVLAMAGLSACGGDRGTSPGGDLAPDLTTLCQELRDGLISGASKDGIPALTDPELVSVGDPNADYLLGTDQVIGLEITGEYVAITHDILWWHEIVNFNDVGLAVTYCPLTWSSMVFDRGAAEEAAFRTSGLLFNNNLVMYDRAPSGEV